MGKIGIISLFNNSYNYGGVLQAYAMNKLVEKHGHEATQICYKRTRKASKNVKKIINNSPVFVIKKFVEKLETKICDYTLSKEDFKKRRIAFDVFKNENIEFTKKVYESSTINETIDLFDAFVTGSDQVWNPNLVDDAYFLDFVPEEKITLSYAASVAAPINEDQHELYKNGMRKLNGISVRENNVKGILDKLTDKKIEWVLDPTLLLEKEDWEKITSNRLIKEPYILCYFLGTDKKIRQLAKKYAKENKCKIVVLPYVSPVHKLSDRSFGDVHYYEAGPDKFLTLLRDAECVFTDSFHAVVFSHIFEKQFWAIQRTGYNKNENRILGLLKLSGLENRFLDADKDYKMKDLLNNSAIDYSLVKASLHEMKEYSLNYLKTYMERIK